MSRDSSPVKVWWSNRFSRNVLALIPLRTPAPIRLQSELTLAHEREGMMRAELIQREDPSYFPPREKKKKKKKKGKKGGKGGKSAAAGRGRSPAKKGAKGKAKGKGKSPSRGRK